MLKGLHLLAIAALLLVSPASLALSAIQLDEEVRI